MKKEDAETKPRGLTKSEKKIKLTPAQQAKKDVEKKLKAIQRVKDWRAKKRLEKQALQKQATFEEQLEEAKQKNRRLPLITCIRCGWQWIPKVENPKTCPSCNSPYWNKAKTRFFVTTPRKDYTNPFGE